jgi:hypothetical protein
VNKYIKKSEQLSFIKSSIDFEIKKRRNSQFNHETFNVDNLTECPRRMMYRANNVGTDNANYLSNLNNECIKEKWLGIFSKLKGIKILDTNIVAADADYNVTSKIDAVFSIDKVCFVLTIDSIESELYELSQKNGGLRKQIVQLMASMWLTNIDNGLLLCENKNTNKYFISHITQSKAIINGIKDKCRKLLEGKILQQLPKRPYDDSCNTECKMCEYNNLCWGITDTDNTNGAN